MHDTIGKDPFFHPRMAEGLPREFATGKQRRVHPDPPEAADPPAVPCLRRRPPTRRPSHLASRSEEGSG